jgi:hypothetical protein
MPYVLQHWNQYRIRNTTLTIICLTYHNTDNNMSYASQHWQQYILRITTLSTLCITYERHIVVNVVIRKPYCCWSCGTQVILLSVLWYVRHIGVSVVIQQYVLRIITLTTVCATYQTTDNTMSYVSQHWQQHFYIVVSVVIRKRYCC